jgi:hypothetical protein
MLNKLPPTKVCVAIAILVTMLVAAVITTPIIGGVLVFALLFIWCITTLIEHYIQ